MPSPASTGAVATTETTPDIDELIARLERLSVEMYKKTPKQLSEEPPVGESTETASEK
jgi:predicted transcriptional regulator